MEEDIKQLKELILDRKSFLTGEKEHDEIYLKDIQAIENVLSRLKQVEEERNTYRKQLNDAFCRGFIHKSKVEELLKKEELPLTIVGGRRNGKTLEYGKKLGRIEVCKELLGKE